VLWLPAATRNYHARGNPWSSTTDPKGCLHTTETSGWPSYNGWAYHPHATIMPTPGRGVTVRQHLPFNQGAFALRNLSGGVQTNRDFVFQFELIGSCERGGPGYFWPNADDAVLKDLFRKVVKPLSDAFKIPLKAPTFQSYPPSYGARGKTNTVRMSGKAFDNYSGWLGHQHVPENSHGDPGAFPWARMLAVGQKSEPPPPEEIEMDAKELKKILAAERKLTVAAVRAEMIDVIVSERLVANKLTNAQKAADPTQPVTFWTLAGILANIETDQDNDRDEHSAAPVPVPPVQP
jgi:hypothetical protein